MNLPIDTCENGSCAFAIRGEYDKRVYANNIGLELGAYLHDNLGAEGQLGFGNLRRRQIKLEKRQMTNKERKA